MKAAVYLRVSTGRQDEAAQEPECLQLCAARGWEPIPFRETTDRDGEDAVEWRRVMAAARVGQVRAVVVWALDRIPRGMFELLRDVRQLDRDGAGVVSVRDTWLDTGGPTRELLLAVFGWVSQHERARLKERTRAGIARARAQGVTLGRPRVVIPLKVLERALFLYRYRESARVGGDRVAPRETPPSWRRLASLLAGEGLGRWEPATLRRALLIAVQKGSPTATPKTRGKRARAG